MKVITLIICAVVCCNSGCSDVKGFPPSAIVDRIEDNNIAVVELCDKDAGLYKMIDIPAEEINGIITEGTVIEVEKAVGKFYGGYKAKNSEGKTETCYQFKSDDNMVWWFLTTEEIGHTPNLSDKYTIYFSQNGTKECDCPPEYDCDCFLYDDIFFSVELFR